MVLDLIGTLVLNIPEVKSPGPATNVETGIDGALSLIFIALGGISLIVVVLQGIKYTLSQGNSEAQIKARNGIIYALVGLVVATSAWNIVNFALDKVIDETSTEAEVNTVVNLLSNIAGLMVFIGGVIAIIMIVVGGLKYVTSSGSPESASKARTTIIYALVGLTVSVVAGPIIGVVLDRLA